MGLSLRRNSITLLALLGSAFAWGTPPDQLKADQLKRTQIPGIVSTLPDDTVRLMGFSGATPSLNQIPVFSDAVGGMNATGDTIDQNNVLTVTGVSGGPSPFVVNETGIAGPSNTVMIQGLTENVFLTLNTPESSGSGVIQFDDSGTQHQRIASALNGSNYNLIIDDIQTGNIALLLDLTNGTANFNDAVEAPNAVLNYRNGHVKSEQSHAVTATVNENAGTGASCSVSHATDSDGQVNLTTTSAASSAGDQCDVNFFYAYNVAPICQLTAANAAAGSGSSLLENYVTSSTTLMSLNFVNADAVGGTYVWNYHCVETQ